MLFGRQPELVLWFVVMDFGSSFEVRLPRYYNVRQTIGPKGKFGRFRVGRQSDLVREYARLLPLPVRLDRIYPDQLTASNSRQG